VRVLDQPLSRALLDACKAPVTAAHLAQKLSNTIDQRTVREQLSWTIRYDNATLKDAFFFSIVRHGKEDHFVATRMQPGFLSDGLLTSLAKASTHPDSSDPLGPSPQRPDGFPIEELLRAKSIHGYVESALGHFPRPSDARANAIRAAAAPSLRLKQERWKMLQWIDLETAAQANYSDSDPFRRVLQWQRLALLRHDCAVFFEDEKIENETVAELLDLAAQRHTAIVRGQKIPSVLRRSKQMPKPQ
jgi:hypothetical protein